MQYVPSGWSQLNQSGGGAKLPGGAGGGVALARARASGHMSSSTPALPRGASNGRPHSVQNGGHGSRVAPPPYPAASSRQTVTYASAASASHARVEQSAQQLQIDKQR